MDAGTRLATAAVFMWLGMVLAISFLEAPLKFRAPGVTLAVGLGIGRLVFRALNACEYVFAIVIAFALFFDETSLGFNVAAVLAFGSLLTQTIVVRPLLSRSTDVILQDEGDGPRSRAHHRIFGARAGQGGGVDRDRSAPGDGAGALAVPAGLARGSPDRPDLPRHCNSPIVDGTNGGT